MERLWLRGGRHPSPIGNRRVHGLAGRKLWFDSPGGLELRPAAIKSGICFRSGGSCGHKVARVAVCALLGLSAAACGGSGAHPASHRARHREGGGSSSAPANKVRLSITPAAGSRDTAPNRGITVRAVEGRITKVTVRTRGDRIVGRLNSAGTVWRSRWALNVSRRYSVIA